MAAVPGETMAILQQIESPISQAQIIEILQRTIDEQGMAFGIAAARAKQGQRIKADRRLREEQEAAYTAALQIDKEKERIRPLRTYLPSGHVSRKDPTGKQIAKPNKVSASPLEDQKLTQILIRFPNGERRERSFLSTEKFQSVYGHVDSLGIPTISNYRLVSTFTRKVYSANTTGMTLKEAGLYPRATLSLEPF